MQNKGFVKVFAALLTLVCLFYLSFSVVTGYHASKADEHPLGSKHYMDSMQNQDVWLGIYSLKECRELEIGLGLDLKGGMFVIMEVSVPDIVKALAGNKEDAMFKTAMENAAVATADGGDFLTAFINEYRKVAPGNRLSSIFATYALKDRLTQNSTDEEVEAVLRDEIKAAVDNSENVLRSRIDRFGVVQPNIQKIEGGMGRIMIELPGIKEPDRVRKLLQGSANLEFWETYNSDEIQREIMPAIEAIDKKIAALDTTSINPLLSRLVGVPGSLCTVAGVHYNDTAAVARMLESADANILLCKGSPLF